MSDFMNEVKKARETGEWDEVVYLVSQHCETDTEGMSDWLLSSCCDWSRPRTPEGVAWDWDSLGVSDE